jgi:flavin reductase (DIM6/NTAB) family NADH-FMN oxidoreductase RutF
MHYLPGAPDQPLSRNPFKAIVAPRPIGWITSLNEDGGVNLAPYSFFNGICEEPPCVMYASTGLNRFRSHKDTLRNIERTGEFVVNVASSDLRDQVRQSGVALPHGESELAATGLHPAASAVIATPRVAEAHGALECRLLKTIEVPVSRGHHQTFVVFGEVMAIYIEDAMVIDGIVDPARLKPLCRLGYNHYGVVESVFRMEVPQ